MKLTDIKNMIGNVIEVHQLLNDVNRIKLNAESGVGASMQKASTIFDGKITSPEIKTLLKQMVRQAGVIEEDRIFRQLALGCNLVFQNMKMLEDRLDDETTKVLMRESLDVRNAQVLQFIAISEYFLEASRIFAVLVAECEAAHQRGEKVEQETLKYIQRNFGERQGDDNMSSLRAFTSVVAYMIESAKKKEDLIEKVFDLPDIKVDEMILTTIQSTEGSNKIDPAGFNLLYLVNPVWYFYNGQKIWSEFKLWRLQLNNDELDYLELRYQELVLGREGKSNPALDRKIEKYQDEIQVKRVKIERLKKKLG